MTDIILSSDTLVPDLSEPNYVDGGLNFLQLVQRLRQEAGVSGSGPTTVVGQSGEYKRLVDWVSTAWMDIQNLRRDWFFMRQAISFNTVATQQIYSAAEAGIASFGNFKTDSFRQYRVSAGYASEYPLGYLPYNVFRDVHLYSSMRERTQLPLNFTVDPSKNFVIGPIPDDVYNINGEGYAMPTEMALDTDRPTMPSQYHMIIVWRALVYYGTYEAASESLQRGQTEYDRMLRQMTVDQIPDFMVGHALA